MSLQLHGGPGAILDRAPGDPLRALSTLSREEVRWLLIGIVLPAASLAVALVWLILTLRRPITEQRRYFRLHQTPPPSTAELRALRCAGAWSYERGMWPGTLEYWPMEQGIGEQAQRKFRTFSLVEIECE